MNKQKALTALCVIVTFIVTYAIITCAWVGAEYILDKAVHVSSVDRAIPAALAYYITRDVYKLDRKYGGKKSGVTKPNAM